MTETVCQSWGRFPLARHTVVRLEDCKSPLPLDRMDGRSCLPFGNGRSYGDSCLNDGGVLLDCRGLDRILSFDPASGVLVCEAGILLSAILDVIVPSGWFLPVTPGTKFVTVGGAIANDVHGKNHHKKGTFGRHVRRLELLRSDGERLLCSAHENAEWFRATVGGLGLTGLITWAEIALVPIAGRWIDREIVRFGNLEEFLDLAGDADRTSEYSVAWVDSLATGKSLGRGLFIHGNHAAVAGRRAAERRKKPRLAVPFEPPFTVLNRAVLKAFNTLYYRKQLGKVERAVVDYEPFFYPLDGVVAWNRLYGPRGLLQHQSAVPLENGLAAVKEMLERTNRAGIGSFLTVLKVFGNVRSPGLLSFPRAGLTLTLDFVHQGERTLSLLDELDGVVRQAGGRANPYKDARMSAASYHAFFPAWKELLPFVDPKFSSSFWRRVMVQK